MPSSALLRRGLPALLLAALAIAALLGVVMADAHEPVAVPPDLEPAGGAQVATFALG